MIFLFEFGIEDNGIEFVINQGIEQDMYEDCDLKLKPVVESIGQKLTKCRKFCKSKVMLTANFLETNEIGFKLDEGVGQNISAEEGNLLLEDAKAITDILIEVMERRTRERSQ